MAATGYNVQTTADTISFRDGTSDLASISFDHATETFTISQDGTGAISFGDTASDIYIGDGVNNVDMIFEVDGSIKGDANVTLTLGSSDSDVSVASPLKINNNLDVTGNIALSGKVDSDLTVDGEFAVIGTNGTLFSVTDDVTGDIFTVSDAGGQPILNVESTTNYDKITIGEYGTNALVISGSSVQVTGSNVVTQGYLSDQNYMTTADETYSTSAELLSSLLTVDGIGSNLDADKLDGQQGSYYLDYSNFSNTPTIPTNNNELTNGAGYITSADGGNAATLDNLDSADFLRSNANDYYSGMLTFFTDLSEEDDWENSPISIKDRDLVGSTQSADKYSPNLNFHWGGRVSNSLWMNYAGVLNYGSYSSAGVPASDGTIKAGSFIKNGGASNEFLKADGSVDTNTYLTSLGTAIVDADFTANGLMKRTGAGTYTSITDNSSNWDAAHTHISATNNPHGVSATDVGLGNVTNESKATMFTSPSFTGDVVITDDTFPFLKSVTNAVGIGINFSDRNNTYDQIGTLKFVHQDTASYGSNAAFILSTTEATSTILADGKLMYGEGIYSKPASGTGAGTRKDSNWDSAYTHVSATNNPHGVTAAQVGALASGTTVDDVSKANLLARLAQFNSSETIYIGDADDDTTVVIRGTLQIDGTTTTVNSTTITVDDKNIELGSIASPTDALADGGGIILKGATDKTITWVDSTDSWTSNQTFSAPNLTLTSLSSSSETTALFINGSNQVTKRLLGSNAFNSTSYLPLSGGTMTGNITFTDDAEGLVWSRNTDGASIKFYNTGDGDTDSRLEFHTNDNNNEYFRWTHTPSGGTLYECMKLVPSSSGNSVLTLNGRLNIGTVDSNTSSTSALVLNGTEVEKRTLGSNAFNSTSIPTSLGSLTDVTITSNASGEILKWNGSAWINNTLSEAGIQASSTALTTSTSFGGDVSGTYDSIVVANDSHTHDGRYFTEDEVNTYFNRGYSNQNVSESSLTSGAWYTIASNTGDRAIARFGLKDSNSGDHQSVIFYAAHHYSRDGSNTITVLHNSHYSGSPFRYIRIKDHETYDGCVLQVYLDGDYGGGAVSAFILGDNFQTSGWQLQDWLDDSTAPSGVSNYSSFAERSRIDLDQIAQGGIATTGPIYGDGDTTQYRMFNDNYHPNADTLTTARTITLGGDLSGSAEFNGSQNVTISATLGDLSSTYLATSGGSLSGNLTIGNTSPYLAINDTNATTTTNLSSFVSFQASGSEKGWVGFGSSANSDLTVRNGDGLVVLYGSSGVKVANIGITIPDGTAAAPALSFTSDTDTGIFRDADNVLRITTGGSWRGLFNSSGITSSSNVYTATSGQFRNFAGVWKATTGTTGNGFQFISADATALTISSTGDVVATGSVTATSLIKSGGTSSEFLKADGSVDTNTYLTSLGTAIVDADFTSNGLMKRTGAGTYTSITDNSSNWDAAHTHISATNNPHGVTAAQVGSYTSSEVDNLLALKTTEYVNLSTASGANNDTHHWHKTHAAYSNNNASPTYIVLTTNVPQDSYSMGGFTLVLQNYYNEADEGDVLNIYGYWNPEVNGGFTGFRYNTSNPECSPTIQVGRNSNGKTVFLISNETGNYAQVIAKDLWFGYTASGASSSWGDDWAFSEASSTTGISNLDTLTRNGITATQVTNWNAAYNWGNHSSAEYLTSSSASAAYLGISDKAADSEKLDGLDSTAFLRIDQDSATQNRVRIGRTLSDTASASWTNTALTVTAMGVDQEAAQTNVLRLARDGTSGVIYAGFADFDMYRHTDNGVEPNVGLKIRLSTSNSSTYYDALTLESDGTILAGTNKIWHEGNDGATSGLDADLLDGNHASAFATASQGSSAEAAYLWGNHADEGYLTSVAANSIGASELKVTGDGTTTQYLKSDGDGTFSWATPPDNNTTYSDGNGISLSGTTFSVAAGGGLTQDAGGLSHSDTSSQLSVDNSGGTVIQDVTLDGYGHVTGLASANLDDRYARRYEGSASNISSSGYTTVATVSGGSLMSAIRMTVGGTANNVVVANVLDIIVNHSQDIQVEALSGNYTRLHVKIISNNDDAYAIQVKTNHANAVTLYFNIIALHEETVTFTSSHSYTGATLEVDCESGKVIKGTGGDLGDVKSYGIFRGNGSGLTSVNASSVDANSIGASELKVGSDGTSTQFLRSDGDGTFSWATPTDTIYTLPVASSSALGGIKIGYQTSGKNYAVNLSSGEAYVNVPWTDTTYTVGDGGLTQNNFTNALKTKLDGITAPNAPTSVSATVVGETVSVSFNASSTSDIDAYLVYSSVDGSDYGLISVIPPDDFSATMEIVDQAFAVTGTQAYRVYAMKYGILSSAGTASVSYTVSSAEPTDMSVVNLNNAYFIQWNPPSANERFVTAYNVYKHESSSEASLARGSASLVYNGLNTSFMYKISGNNNNNYHQFWVETTIA